MLTYYRVLTHQEIVLACAWMREHAKTCTVHSVGKYNYDHDITTIETPTTKYKGIAVTIKCLCGQRQLLGKV